MNSSLARRAGAKHFIYVRIPIHSPQTRCSMQGILISILKSHSNLKHRSLQLKLRCMQLNTILTFHLPIMPLRLMTTVLPMSKKPISVHSIHVFVESQFTFCRTLLFDESVSTGNRPGFVSITQSSRSTIPGGSFDDFVAPRLRVVVRNHFTRYHYQMWRSRG
jgi:hypothetical protein